MASKQKNNEDENEANADAVVTVIIPAVSKDDGNPQVPLILIFNLEVERHPRSCSVRTSYL